MEKQSKEQSEITYRSPQDWRERFKQEGSRALSQVHMQYDEQKKTDWSIISNGLLNPYNTQLQKILNNLNQNQVSLEQLKENVGQVNSKNKIILALSRRFKDKIFDQLAKDRQDQSDEFQNKPSIFRRLAISLQMKLKQMIEEEMKKMKVPKNITELRDKVDSLLEEQKQS
ncbi:UNKNOWN [Stylonychia lemnae]|uniref:Uncharacterized protein n=1 Tax=Stylonychia lemnae TaxID=5949 RepID=A0A078AZ56_STYLE|nr:UNKNOWN [Stylonychia lemnae]|eukprot:CDW87381.1 UNKNOWN [Stylonychia lemnae]